MINELDTVVLTRDLPEHGLETGDVGAVVHIYPGAAASFEVEFVSAEGRTLALVTLPASDLRPMAGPEILHARRLAS